MGIPDYLTCLLRNFLYVGQEATVRTGHGKTDWFKLGERWFKPGEASNSRFGKVLLKTR